MEDVSPTITSNIKHNIEVVNGSNPLTPMNTACNLTVNTRVWKGNTAQRSGGGNTAQRSGGGNNIFRIKANDMVITRDVFIRYFRSHMYGVVLVKFRRIVLFSFRAITTNYYEFIIRRNTEILCDELVSSQLPISNVLRSILAEWVPKIVAFESSMCNFTKNPSCLMRYHCVTCNVDVSNRELHVNTQHMATRG